MQTTPELERFLARVPLFQPIRPEDLRELVPLLTPETLSAGQLLFREGEAGVALWILDGGAEVTISAHDSATGRPRALAYARVGDTVGEMALIDEGRRSGTALVVRPGRAYRLDAFAFSGLRKAFRPAAYEVVRSLCRALCVRLRTTSDRIVPPSVRPPPAPTLSLGPKAPPELLDRVPSLASLPEVVKLALSQKLTLVELPGVRPLFSEGEPGDAAYFVVEGAVMVGRNGRTLAELGPGKLFGIVAAIDQGARSASCVSAGPARLLRLSDRDFESLFSAGNRFAFQLVDVVCRQLVEHLREANLLLPLVRHAPTHRPVPGLAEEEFLPEAELLPLELEMELDASPGQVVGLSGRTAH